MSEYIVDGAEPNSTVLKSTTPNGYEHEKWLPVREEIVRCRDCRFYKCGDDGWWCLRSISTKSNHSDGFCAWGVKREEDGE